MLNVAYLANAFPTAVEPYVVEEIRELRKRGARVIATSLLRPQVVAEEFGKIAAETLYVEFSISRCIRAALLCVLHCRNVIDLLVQALTNNAESFPRRIRAVMHTFLGTYYAAMLSDLSVEHIHVHHGYFAAWVAMTAARLLGITYSMTLHGSDLLLHRAYLDLKLRNCKFCLTISEFNRQHILSNYPGIPKGKIRVQRMGVEILNPQTEAEGSRAPDSRLVMLSVGRLHAVKDHAFLLRACSRLKERGRLFTCLIAGEGPERANLEKQIIELNLNQQVTLLGHVPRAKLVTYYALCDLAVLTSRSEGIPLTLMEAMAHGRAVLAPAITGVPELVVHEDTGFLYRPGSLEDFVAKVEAIHADQPALSALLNKARRHVSQNFNRAINLAGFGELFPALVASNSHENSLLQ